MITELIRTRFGNALERGLGAIITLIGLVLLVAEDEERVAGLVPKKLEKEAELGITHFYQIRTAHS